MVRSAMVNRVTGVRSDETHNLKRSALRDYGEGFTYIGVQLKCEQRLDYHHLTGLRYGLKCGRSLDLRPKPLATVSLHA
jgi:hypothetical protein